MTHDTWRDADPDAICRDLFARARLERAPARSRARLAAALGVGVATTTVAGSATATAGIASQSGKAIALLVGKWMLIGAVAGTVVARGSSALTGDTEPAELGAVVATPAAARAPAPSPPAARPGAAEAVPAEAATVTVPTPRTDPVGARPASASAAPEDSPQASEGASPLEAPPSLSAEVRLLDRARAALAASDPARAVALLDDYARFVPRGSLSPEAAALRVDALAASGNGDAARRAAARFLEEHPESPLADRVKKATAKHRTQ